MEDYEFFNDITSYLLHGVSELIIEDLHKSKRGVFHYGLSDDELEEITSFVKQDMNRTPTLGEFINEMLYKMQMTQRELAEKAGFSKAYISNIINGRINPPKYKLVRIAFAMNLSVEEANSLLHTRGFTFNKSLKDMIIVACLDLEIYDLIKVEEALNKVANANETLYD